MKRVGLSPRRRARSYGRGVGCISLAASLWPSSVFAAELLCRLGVPGAPLPAPIQRWKTLWRAGGSFCDLRSPGSKNCQWESRAVGQNLGWELEATLQSFGGTVCSVAWAKDGTKILVGNVDGNSDIWELFELPAVGENETSTEAGPWKQISKLRGHIDAVHSLAFAPGGHFAITGSADGTARLWSDANDGWAVSSILQGHSDAVWEVEWTNNESRVLTGAGDRTGCLWKSLKDYSFDNVVVQACPPVSPRAHGSTVLVESYDRTARLWRAEGPETPPRWRVEARLQDRHRHSHIILDAALSDDGERLLTGSTDGIARIWHGGRPPPKRGGIGHDRDRWELLGVLTAHVSEIWAVAWAPDEGHVLTASRDGVTHIWRPSPSRLLQWEVAGTLQEIRCLFTADNAVESVFYGGLNITDTIEGDLENWEAGKEVVVSAVPGAYLVVTTRNNEPSACRTGGFAMSCSNGLGTHDVGVHLGWEAVGGSETFGDDHRSGGGSGWAVPRSSRSRFFLRGVPNTKKICANDERYSVYRIRLATQAARGLAAFADRVAASRSTVGIAVAGSQESYGEHGSLVGDLQRSLVETPAATGINSFRTAGEDGHPPPVWVAAWSSNGTKVITGSRDGSARVWRLLRASPPMQWKLEATLKGHDGIIWSVAWSPDGNKLLTAGGDGLTRVWTLTGIPLASEHGSPLHPT